MRGSCLDPTARQSGRPRCWTAPAGQQRTHRSKPWVCKSAAGVNVRVVGVGGAGSAAVASLWDTEACSHLSMTVIDTDVQGLTNVFLPDHDRVLIGARTSKWGGTRGDPSLGEDAALESSEDIGEALEGADLVFVLAGMGGGTGQGAAPVVADTARQQGAFTVGIAWPGTHQHHLQAMQRLHAAVDVLLTSPADAAAGAHLLPLSTCIQGVARLVGGYQPLAVEDLQAMLSGSSSTLWCAVAQGPDRVAQAAAAVVSSSGCREHLKVASAVLCFVSSSEQFLDESEVELAQQVVAQQCPPTARLHVRAVDASEHLPPGHAVVALVVSARTPQGGGREGQQAADRVDSSSSSRRRGDSGSGSSRSADGRSSGGSSYGDGDGSGNGNTDSSGRSRQSERSGSNRPGVVLADDVSDAAAAAAGGDPVS